MHSATLQNNPSSALTTVERGLEFLSFMHSDASNLATINIATALGAVWVTPAAESDALAGLDAVTADGTTILVQLPGAGLVSAA